MAQEYQPGMEIEVQLWRSGKSSGKLSLGLGINENTRQLLFSFGKIISDEEPARWIVAERHLRLLEFFVNHKIYFDGRLDRSGKQYGQRGGDPTFEIHYESDSYETFPKLLEAKTNQESGKTGCLDFFKEDVFSCWNNRPHPKPDGFGLQDK